MKRASLERVFIPEFNGNRDLPEAEQVSIEMKIATIKERDVYSILKGKKGGGYTQTKKEFTALKNKVTRINNYFDDLNNPIDTAEKLIEDVKKCSIESNELALEIWNRIMGYSSLLEGEDEENESEDLTEGED